MIVPGLGQRLRILSKLHYYPLTSIKHFTRGKVCDDTKVLENIIKDQPLFIQNDLMMLLRVSLIQSGVRLSTDGVT